MSRSYAVLAAALVGVAGLGGIAQIVGSDADAGAEARIEPAAVGAAAPAVGDEQEPTALAVDVRDAAGLEPIALIDPDCSLSVGLELGDEHPEVACLESQLIAAGVLVDVAPDELFDEPTDAAVRRFQGLLGLVADGVVGPQTARLLGTWVGPDVLPPDDDTCPATGRSAVVDRFNQRAWLCDDGEIAEVMPMTSAVSQPDPGTYSVYAKDLRASSEISGDYSEMTHFVAFTYGKYQAARIAFHSVPTYPNGEFVQPLDSLGTAEMFGASAGCIRVHPDDAELIWEWLDVGDAVVVVT